MAAEVHNDNNSAYIHPTMIILVSNPRFLGSKNAVKPFSSDSESWNLMKSNMADKMATARMHIANNLAHIHHTMVNLVSHHRFLWSRNAVNMCK